MNIEEARAYRDGLRKYQDGAIYNFVLEKIKMAIERGECVAKVISNAPSNTEFIKRTFRELGYDVASVGEPLFSKDDATIYISGW